MPLKIFSLLVLACTALDFAHAGRILAIVPTPSYSHQVAFHQIWKELSLRGHDVTLLTTDPIKDEALTNLTQIDASFTYKLLAESNFMEEINNNRKNYFKMLSLITTLAGVLEEEILNMPEIQRLVQKDNGEHFDLVMVEALGQSFYAFGRRYNCPVISVSSMDATIPSHNQIGNPNHPTLYPEHLLPFSGQLTFFQRVFSSFHHLAMLYRNDYMSAPLKNHNIKTYFGQDYPDIEHFQKNLDMVFLNTNPILNTIRPLVPAVVQIGGGTHMKPVEPLPKDISDFLGDAPNGVVYFSLGSNVKSNALPNDTKEGLMQVFAELPYKVLWKFEDDNLPGKPDNVKIAKWLPQQDVLRHKNVKVFVTQGGLQSMEESLYSHKPMVGMPFFGDQDNNVKKIVDRGYGLRVEPKPLDKVGLKAAILEVAENDVYRNKVKTTAELSLDQPMTGLEKAIWWTEYVLRHKGAKHLRSPAIDLPLYQYLLLDVIGVCLAAITIVLSLVYLVLRSIKRVVVYFFRKLKLKSKLA